LLARFRLLQQLPCMKYCAYSRGQISLGVHPLPSWGSTSRGVFCLFPAILNGIYPSANSFIWRSMCP
jgi:hypothetical protein